MTVPQDADKITNYIVHHKLYKRVMEENKSYFSVKVNSLTIGFVEDGGTFKEFSLYPGLQCTLKDPLNLSYFLNIQ